MLDLFVFTIFCQLVSSFSLLLLSTVSLALVGPHQRSSVAVSLGLTTSQGSSPTRHRRKLRQFKNIRTLISSFHATLDSCLNSINSFHPENKQQLPNLLAPGILYIGQSYCYSPEKTFYIFSQQIKLIIYFRFAGTISVYSSTKCHVFHNASFFGS